MNNTTLQRAAEVNEINNINEIVIDFDGSGDSGQMDEVACYPDNKHQLMKTQVSLIRCSHRFADGKWSLIEELVEDTAEEVAQEIGYSILENHHGGWEINEGSFGKIRINADGSGLLEYHERIIETNYRSLNFNCLYMANPYHHALSSVKKWGGKPEDYLPIHNWFDETKAHFADFRHRAMRHHSEGIFLMEKIFGPTLQLSNEMVIPTRWVGEQHVKEDLLSKSI